MCVGCVCGGVCVSVCVCLSIISKSHGFDPLLKVHLSLFFMYVQRCGESKIQIGIKCVCVGRGGNLVYKCVSKGQVARS